MKNPVCFAYAPEALPADSRLPDRPELFTIMRSLDLSPFVTVGAEAALAGPVVRTETLPGDNIVVQTPVAPSDIDLLVNRLNRSIKPERLPGLTIPPMINENAVRKIGYHKERAAAEVLLPLGLGLPTAVISTPADVEQFVATHVYDQYFLKPRHGSFSAGTHKLGKSALAKFYAEQPDKLDKLIVQPAYDFTLPLPRSIKPLDRQSTEQFDDLNVAGVTKELRMYGFVSPGQTELYPAARVLRPNLKTGKTDSSWFFVDPESVPENLTEQTIDVLSRTVQLTDSKALYAAVDFGYGTVDQGRPHWKVIELNALAPGMISRAENAAVATKLKTLLAEQIRKTIDYIAK